MEDGLNGVVVTPELNNGVASPSMANLSETEESTVKVNGDSNAEEYSSESDALVIDEKNGVNNSPESELIPHFNPYFNESIFELSQQHQQPLSFGNKRLKAKNSPKLREYAQYLGLQPTVQFKCSRCGRAGFESLTTLNEHIVKCTDEPCTEPPQENSNSFKLTRKVFLCSACGTYYENWNLYLHMIEVHRRYLCLYCLGMFSVLDDLCLHIQSRHNLEPGHKDSLDDFFSAYSDPCYIVCCECNKLFNEQDNFFYHNCAGKSKNQNKNKVKNKQIKPQDHVTGETQPNSDKIVDLKTSKSSKKLPPEQEETVNEPVNSVPKPEEIVYSTDDELDFKGFAESGEPVYRTAQAIVVDEPPPKSPAPAQETNDNMDVDETLVETRKVPKLSLKLKPGFFPEIERHEHEQESEEKLESESIENNDNDNEIVSSPPPVTPPPELPPEIEPEPEPEACQQPEMNVAGAEIQIIELELEQPLDKFDIRILLQKCLKATAPSCLYCNHARKIAVNGQQLGLHAIAEHRFSAVVHSITAEELIPESFVSRIKEGLSELENAFFSLESSPTDEGVTFSHVFECFQCRYSTLVHKELYLHNRKSHAKNLLLCIMCKSNFYSYSELICHLCPGVYILDYDVGFRCCMCCVSDDIPSAFRLMVHLRKRHHVCDVCLEMCNNQYKLSNHVWKHKLHHFCYRCGIAYRNKPDITRHLFWKHGTESVLCKKCLQKKWPHVYHFCVPPLSFTCDDCQLQFSKAVSLKVHKRIHTNEKPHACTIDNCEEKFISKKLLAKHEHKHKEPPEEENVEVKYKINEPPILKENEEKPQDANKEEKLEEKVTKPKVDVYDLPELNLSESDTSDSENEMEKKPDQNPSPKEEVVEERIEESVVEEQQTDIEPVNNEVVENIWDNFKNYQANKEKFDHMFIEADKLEIPVVEPEPVELTLEVALRDHDYCIDPDNKPDVSFTEVKPDLSQSVDHDYCTAKKDHIKPPPEENDVRSKIAETKVDKKETSSSDSSSDSDSSSCSCGPNCSCSSSSGSSSSSSDSSDSDSSTEEGRRRQQIRREKRKQRVNKVNTIKKQSTVVKEPITITETPILESDLETTESDTDEEFYDKQPHLLAKKILEEKRNQLLAGMEQTPNGTLENRSATPNLPEEESEQIKPKKKSKSKKKKKKKSGRKELVETDNSQYYQYYQPPTVAPITLTLQRNSPISSPKSTPSNSIYMKNELDLSREDLDGSLRASKRRRVPNKFYGYSSDEEEKLAGIQKWRKTEPVATLTVPPITIKAPPQVQFRATPPIPTVRKVPPIKIKSRVDDGESEGESNDSSNEGRNMLQVNPDALYCYCKCPYDEVSEMIGCDARDCSIEWFHFECVGIMVPPKGHWYCPECRKKRQQKREALKLKAKAV